MPPPVQPGATAAPTANPLKAKIDLSGEFNKLRDIYGQRAKTKANFLIIGKQGSGKTFNLQYAPGPVLIHSFDPGGSIGMTEAVASGRVLVDTRFENESAAKPQAYRLWERTFLQYRRDGVFDGIGTYVIDSLRPWASSLMYEIMKERGRKPPERSDLTKDPDIVPELGDYNLQQKTLMQNLADVMNLPCNVVIIGHISVDKDQVTGANVGRVLVDGRTFPDLIPTLFDEVYFAEALSVPPTNDNPRGQKFIYRTVPKSIFNSRSRLSAKGILGAEEPQNIQAILKKAGYAYEDKPLFNE